jgi:hypothetical protein
MSKSKSWVWRYAKRIGDNSYCNMCDKDDLNEFAYAGGSTGSLGRHLKFIHNLWPKNSQTTELTRYNHFLFNVWLHFLIAARTFGFIILSIKA